MTLRSLFLEPEYPLRLHSALISANCFKGHFVSTFCPLSSAAMAFSQENLVVTCSWGHMGWGGHGLPQPLPGITALSGAFPDKNLCSRPCLSQGYFRASPPDSRIPRHLSPCLSGQSGPFPGPGSLGKDSWVAQQPPP